MLCIGTVRRLLDPLLNGSKPVKIRAISSSTTVIADSYDPKNYFLVPPNQLLIIRNES